MTEDRFAQLRKTALENPTRRALFDALADGRKYTPEELLARVPEAETVEHVEAHMRNLQRAELIERDGEDCRQTVEAQEGDF